MTANSFVRRTMTKTRRISLLILSVLLSAVTVVSGFTVYRELSLQQKEKDRI